VQNLSYENEFDLHENEPVVRTDGRTLFHMNGFIQRLFLTPRQKATRKWPIVSGFGSVDERGGGSGEKLSNWEENLCCGTLSTF